MEHKAAKIGTSLAAAVLGLGLPAVASAQEYPSTDLQPTDQTTLDQTVSAPELPTISQAVANMGAQAQMLSNLGQISSDDVAMVSLNDIGLGADQRYTLMQSVDPSQAATLQQALQNVQVAENNSLAGQPRTLAEHLQTMGVEPSSVVAANVGDDGTVTIYYQ
ncbi:MAG: hypothetical protein JO083_01510 [Candidatus Eremiobacteraeota bacterium]|nr:hypothetical protein [Candidatus Eremiobacteraeota bacterium]